jgi:hypothetical protein
MNASIKISMLWSMALLALAPPFLYAGEADVTDVKVERSSEGTYSFQVTVAHGDTGWEHYADKWDIVDGQGTVLTTRVLHHPHVDEQPFSRSLSGVKIPANITEIRVRAHDSVHGYGGKTISVELP